MHLSEKSYPGNCNTERLLTTGGEYYQSLISSLDAAQISIDFEVYIFEPVGVGYDVVEALINASRRGVTVRLLMDGFGSAAFSREIIETLQLGGVNVRIFHPLPWLFWQWHGKDSLLNRIQQLNHRNHRKTCVIDDEVAFVGSFNVSQVHLGKEKGGEGWQDLGLKLTGCRFSPLKQAFQKAWSRKFWHYPKIMPKGVFRLNFSKVRRRRCHQDLLQRIEQAEKKIWISNAYFVPGFRLLKVLSEAAKRGVDVKIVLSTQSDIIFIPWVSSVFYHLLLCSGVKIFEYQLGIMHKKVMMIDDWVTLGSSNLNHRSFLHDLEVDVVVQ
ncbi:MAG: cardiolipin synthase B, partial [Methylococcales bacterium]|nr:cardiolipin synthase B [Methylococcales bacterium]